MEGEPSVVTPESGALPVLNELLREGFEPATDFDSGSGNGFVILVIVSGISM